MKPITIATAIDVSDKYGAGSKISDTKMPFQMGGLVLGRIHLIA